MWRHTAQTTGTNEVPIANPRRFGGAASGPPPPGPPPPANGDGRYDDRDRRDYDRDGRYNDRDGRYDDRDRRDADRGRPEEPLRDGGYPEEHGKRGREEDRASSGTPGGEDGDQPRKRRSRWGTALTSTANNLPTAILNANVSQQQLDNYASQMRIEEINQKLRSGDFVPPERERSPSPPPTYDSHGRRTNTREVRYRQKLENERLRLTDRLLKSDPNYRPPAEYHAQKRAARPQEKVYIPVKEFPEINFFGLLVGPRGNSLKGMERESGAKISIRGKGSVKEGKGRPGAYSEQDEEDLHCVVMADSMDKVALCVKLINKVIETAASTPEGQNDHKRNQLRELAALNGTLRDDENQICQNCGGVGHRKYECPEQRNYTANIICRVCGQAGHMARDCTQRHAGFGRPGLGGPPGAAPVPGVGGGPASQFDSEYANLMAELGEGGPGVNRSAGPAGMIEGGSGGAPGPAPGFGTPGGSNIGPDGKKIPPWRNPEIWANPSIGTQIAQQAGYAPRGHGPPPPMVGAPGGYPPQNAPYGSAPAGAPGAYNAGYAGYTQQPQGSYGGYQQQPAAATPYQGAYAGYYQQPPQ